MNTLEERTSDLIRFWGLITTGLIAFLLFFQVALNRTTEFPTFFDEIILAFILPIAIIKSFRDEIIKRFITIYAVTFTILLLLSIPSISSRGITSVIFQIFIHLKYILFIIFFWVSFKNENALRLTYIFLFITVFFLFINLVTGNLFNLIFDAPTLLRGGLVRPIGIQADTASLGTTFALLGCLFACYSKYHSLKYKVLVLLAFSIFILLASTRTALLLIPLVILWWLKDSFKSFFIASMFIAVVLIGFGSSKYVDTIVEITSENIEWTLENPVESGYIRGIMLYFSFELANDRFPIGTGAATFGTVTSDDSPVYAEIGLHNSRFFVEKEGIYDSNFASILGEFGYVGILIYYITFYFILLTPLKNNLFYNENEFRFILFLLVGGYSIATPIFMNSYPAFMLALVIVASYCKLEKRPAQS